MTVKGTALGTVVLVHWLAVCHELFEACTVDVNPGSPMSVALVFERSHGTGRAVPDNWWGWVVQLLIPTGGPAITSSTAAGEGLAVLTVRVLLAVLEAVVARVAREDLRPTAGPHFGLVRSVQPVPAGGSPAVLVPSPTRQGGSDEQIQGDDRGRRSGAGSLRAAHPVRELPRVHDRREAGHPALRHRDPLGHGSRRPEPRVRRPAHRVPTRPEGRLAVHRRTDAVRGHHAAADGRRPVPPDRLAAGGR